MKSYAILEHTADIRLHVKGDSLPELFLASLSGMNEILCKDDKLQLKKHSISFTIEVFSVDTTSLLIDFLSEALTLSQVHKAIINKANFLVFEPTHVRAQLIGVKVDSFTEDIKAVTYHEANVVKNVKGEYETMIVFDI